MALVTVNVTGNITLPDGSDATGAILTFTLSQSDYDQTSNYAVPGSSVSVTLGSGGALDIDLWPNDRGTKGTYYEVFATWVNDSNRAVQVKMGTIQPVSVGTNDIADLLALTEGHKETQGAFETKKWR